MTARRIVFIGAAGEMCRLAIDRFAKADGDWHLVLCDLRPEIVEPLAKRLPAGRASVRRLDLFDHANLLEVIDGAALVVLGAGPYIRTSEPVLTACLEAKVPYLDFDDDVESTQHALSLHEKAREAGIPVYVGCGASPGMSNVLARDAANQLDSVEDLTLGWMVGDERPAVGRAVLQHLMHIAAGDCLTWENGGPVVHESYVETTTLHMGGGVGEILLYETAHPEPTTLPRHYPDARRIRCVGGLDPEPFNGMARGVALAIQAGRLTMDEAVDYMLDVLARSRFFGNARALRAALGGAVAQVLRGENTWSNLIKFLFLSALRRRYVWRGGLIARASGTRDGRPAVAVRRTPISGPDAYLAAGMGTLTGTACAAFMVLALDETGERAGAFAPEDWADPQAFYTALERVGTPRHEIVESVH
ncbi:MULTISPECIES: saccharopine dehydrogenase family protein [unclassified Streptomyces]|uniref:saccharopine dehydrogenase family protein n=1 Tax=unclassified Streptomyces TaxID=2593676 RepID=UPI0001D05CD5|nr:MULTISPECIES: saccharopine dehydrogenase NADP-binding domain-containing protein [unclassified Streptomyces]EFF88733.1 saccharopine dehydrogenase [Streptomyces sp. e14]NED37795.1 saccharopine dehydrogenase [Streptomyces sp. SID8499]NED73851.1 saccharopine dehydrogenase [Streptomyces sp. SID9944]